MATIQKNDWRKAGLFFRARAVPPETGRLAAASWGSAGTDIIGRNLIWLELYLVKALSGSNLVKTFLPIAKG